MNVQKQVAKTKEKLKRWFGAWVVHDTHREISHDGPIKILEDYLAGGTKRALLGGKVEHLSFWHFCHYGDAVLNESRYPMQELALSARYAQAALFFEKAFADSGKGGSVVIEQSVLDFSLNVLAGWKAEAGAIGRALHAGLNTSLLDLRHNNEHQAGELYRHFWFLMHLYCQADGVQLDTSKYSYPADMSPYSDVLADWRTTDLNKVQSFVTAMSDFHVAEARVTEHGEIAEFDTEDRMLFPHEILTFLRLREWAGLANPTSFDHPLMNQPLAKMPEPVPLPQPDTPLLDEVIAKFKLEYPGSFTA